MKRFSALGLPQPPAGAALGAAALAKLLWQRLLNRPDRGCLVVDLVLPLDQRCKGGWGGKAFNHGSKVPRKMYSPGLRAVSGTACRDDVAQPASRCQAQQAIIMQKPKRNCLLEHCPASPLRSASETLYLPTIAFSWDFSASRAPAAACGSLCNCLVEREGGKPY